MLITEIGYIRIESETTPAQTFIKQSTIIDGSIGLKAMSIGYEPTYQVYLSRTFVISYNGQDYVSLKNINGYSNKCELEIYEFKSLGNKSNARINKLVITNLECLEFDLGNDNIDYTKWQELQEEERFAVFGRIK